MTWLPLLLKINLLICICCCSSEGDRLGNCWNTVISCISEFERLHLIGVGARSDSSFFNESAITPNNSIGPASATKPNVQRAATQININSGGDGGDQTTGNAHNVLKQVLVCTVSVFMLMEFCCSKMEIYFKHNNTLSFSFFDTD